MSLCHCRFSLFESYVARLPLTHLYHVCLDSFKSKKMDPEVIYLFTKVSYDEDNDKLTNGLFIQLFLEELQARDPIISAPVDYIMIYQASIRLRGLAHALHQPRSLAKAWKPIAEKVLREDI